MNFVYLGVKVIFSEVFIISIKKPDTYYYVKETEAGMINVIYLS